MNGLIAVTMVVLCFTLLVCDKKLDALSERLDSIGSGSTTNEVIIVTREIDCMEDLLMEAL